MKTHYSAAELAARKLPGLPGTEQNIRFMADRESWSFVEVKARGKTGTRREYALTSLPEAARLALAEEAAGVMVAAEAGPVTKATAPLPVVAAPLQPLKTSQIDTEMARERIFKFVSDFGGSEPRAIDHLNAGYHQQTLPTPLMWAMNNAWSKRRADTRLTRDTLQKWKAVKKQRGRSAPLVRQKDMEVKPWHALAIALKQRPQGSCLTYIHEEIKDNWNAKWGDTPPSYDVVRHFFTDKFSQIDQLKGRHTGSALAPHKHYVKRSSAGMLPWDEIHADGWNTHFTAPHPVTGEYVTYELWHAHDVATRFVPPFGIGLTENFEVIAKCVEEAIRFGGCMAILQTDSTKIVKNSERFKTNPATSLADRVGFTIVHPQTVGNSQANGIAENFNTWMDKESRELATYQAKGMDSLTLKRVKKLTAKAVKAQKSGDYDGYAEALLEAERMGKGRVFRSHQEACDWIEAKRQKWNNKPHRSLPRIRDSATGALRHQSPAEALQQARDNGWNPELFPEEYMIAMFRPHMQTKVSREAVSPYGGMRYHHECLGDWNGKEVVVAYDIMNWQQVWVKTLQGELICVASFAEATGYRTQSAKEAADEKRALAQIKHRERQIDAIRERAGLDSIEGEATRVNELAEVANLAPRLSDAELIEVEARQAKPKPKDMMDLAMWLYEDQINADCEGDPLKESAAS
jgi:putative transposase